jgi:hypothetical protein
MNRTARLLTLSDKKLDKKIKIVVIAIAVYCGSEKKPDSLVVPTMANDSNSVISFSKLCVVACVAFFMETGLIPATKTERVWA